MSNNIESKPVCVFQAPLFLRSGYSGWSMAVAKSLLDYGKFDVHFVPTRWGACNRINERNLSDTDKLLLTKVLREPLKKKPDVYIQMTIPNEFQPLGNYNIGMTAGIETTVARGEWVEGLNRMDMNVVLSKHAKDVFEMASYTKHTPVGDETIRSTKPMEVVFWGADTEIFKKDAGQEMSVDIVMDKIKEDFAFLFVGQWTGGDIFGDRKDIGMLIKTFLTAFKDKDKQPCLIIKTSGAKICEMDKHDMLARIKQVASSVSGKLPNVYLFYGDLNDTEMNALYNHDKVKAHVSFSHGEGFGHPLLLATLTDKPVIAPKWSGHLDFMNPSYASFFKGSLVNVPDHALNDYFIKGSQWFNVDYREAEEKMKTVYYYYGNVIREKAAKLGDENRSKFSLLQMDKVLHTLLDKYVPKFGVHQSIVLPTLKKLGGLNK